MEDADWCIEQTLFFGNTDRPLNMILDDGGDLTNAGSSINIPNKSFLHIQRSQPEETCTGVHRLYERMEKRSRPPHARVQVSTTPSRNPNSTTNEMRCKESLVDSIRRATDVMMAGKVAVVGSYGDVGKGSAASSKAPAAA